MAFIRNTRAGDVVMPDGKRIAGNSSIEVSSTYLEQHADNPGVKIFAEAGIIAFDLDSEPTAAPAAGGKKSKKKAAEESSVDESTGSE